MEAVGIRTRWIHCEGYTLDRHAGRPVGKLARKPVDRQMMQNEKVKLSTVAMA